MWWRGPRVVVEESADGPLRNPPSGLRDPGRANSSVSTPTRATSGPGPRPSEDLRFEIGFGVGDRQPVSFATVSRLAEARGSVPVDRWAGLLVASGRGEHASFELLAQESRTSLRFRARRRVSSVEEADEIVHDALLHAWCAARSYDPLRWSASWLGQLVEADYGLVQSALSRLPDLPVSLTGSGRPFGSRTTGV